MHKRLEVVGGGGGGGWLPNIQATHTRGVRLLLMVVVVVGCLTSKQHGQEA